MEFFDLKVVRYKKYKIKSTLFQQCKKIQKEVYWCQDNGKQKVFL